MNPGSHEEDEQIEQKEVVGDPIPHQESPVIVTVKIPDHGVERPHAPRTIPIKAHCRSLAITTAEEQDDTVVTAEETSSIKKIDKGKGILEIDHEPNDPDVNHLLFKNFEAIQDVSERFSEQLSGKISKEPDVDEQGFRYIGHGNILIKNSQSREIDVTNYPKLTDSLVDDFPTVKREEILPVLGFFKKTKLEEWEIREWVKKHKKAKVNPKEAVLNTTSTKLEEPELTDEQTELLVQALTNSPPSSPQSQSDQGKDGKIE